MSSSIDLVNIPVFAGQGTTAINSHETRQQALRDADLPSGSVLLAACFQAFISELSALAPTDLGNVEVVISDFATKESLLVLHERYLHNPVITGPTLFLIQVLRYLFFIEGIGASTNSLTPFADILRCNRKYAVGILAFSSGILPACVVGTSNSVVDFISRAVEAFRLTIWIGVRSQLYRKEILSRSSSQVNPSLPWSLVLFGLSRQAVEEALTEFNKEFESTPLYITAVMDDSSATISGLPDALAKFAGVFGPGVVVHKTTVDTLYHVPILKQGVRKQLLTDVIKRKISFADFSDIHTPVRSTFTGELITKYSFGRLVEVVLDLLLTQPVNWNLVMDKVAQRSREGMHIRLLNIGPGTGLARSIERALARSQAALFDLTVSGKLKSPKQEPIAVIGMAIHMPGAASTLQLWNILEQGINTITEIPEHRFKVSDYNDITIAKEKRFMKAHTGNFIDGVDEFDHQFFKISPREAKYMDPQQRILLHTAYEALENAGYVPNSSPTFHPDRFGCFIGAATQDYVHNLKDDIDVYYSTGTLRAFLSGRISYAMQLNGPSMVVDTACSSSIAAVYQGARALMNRDCDAVMVGGINVISSPDMFLGLDKGHFLSPTGQCRPFDAAADGYSRSEGCGVFVLKRLSDAINEKDQILGVIRGVEINQSGLARSITHPHAPTQVALFERLLENSGLGPQQVNIIEAHGTGTQAGDPCEMESIRRVFCKGREAANPLYVTSIKANIGHLEAASGAAGLAKILLMIRSGIIPKQISLEKLNPRIASLERDNIMIPLSNNPWEPSRQGLNRIAVLNNFGASGSNAALIIEEFPVDDKSRALLDMSFVFGLSAKNINAAEALRDKYIKWLLGDECDGIQLADIAYTTTARRQLYGSRLAVSASSKEELIKKLENAKVVQAEERDATIAFVFSGQGSQYLGMGSSLYASSPLFKRHIDECHAILTSAGFSDILPIIAPGTGYPDFTNVLEIEAYQTALVSFEYALAKLWMSWGLRPAVVTGHSLGEYAALVIAGVLSLQDALMLVANRARIMIRKCEARTTGMIAVHLGSDEVKGAIGSSSSFLSLSVACYNSSVDCIVAGPLKDIKKFKKFLDNHLRCPCTILPVPFGYHSSAMNPVLDDLLSVARTITTSAPSIPIVSNLHAKVVFPGNESVFDASYFSRHCAEPVQFQNGVATLSSIFNIDTWIEVGPHAITLSMLKCNESVPQNVLLLASIHKHCNAWSTLASSLSSLYTSGVRVRWRNVFSHIDSVSCVNLPSYPFAKSKFWIPFRELRESISAAAITLDHRLSGSFVQYPSLENDYVAILETPISKLASFIVGHCVSGIALCPASLYMEQVFASIELCMQLLGIDSASNRPILRDMVFSKPLTYDETIDRRVITTIKVGEGSGSFKISSRLDALEEFVHVQGQYRLHPRVQIQFKFARLLPIVDCGIISILKPRSGKYSEVFSGRTTYEVIFSRVVKYSKEYQTIKSIFVSADGMEAYAKIGLQSIDREDVFSVHPIFLDTLLHVAGFVANLQGDGDVIFICSDVGTVKVLAENIKTDVSYAIYCSNVWLPEQNFMIADAYAVSTSQPKKIVAHLKGMHFRRTRMRSFAKILSVAARGRTSRRIETGHVDLSLVTDKLCASTIDTSSNVSISEVSSSVITVVADACNIDRSKVKLDTDLAVLGVDSLMSIEMAQRFQNMFPRMELDAHTLYCSRTVEQIIGEISVRITNGPPSSVTSSTIPPSASGTSSPRTLVFDDSQTSFCVDDAPNIKKIISSVLDIDVGDINDNQELQLMGLDSLSSMEMLHVLKQEFSLDLPSDLFVSCKTLRALRGYLSGVQKRIDVDCKHASSSSVVAGFQPERIPYLLQTPNNPSSDHPSLILIHDGSGLTTYYDRLTSLDRTVWAINNPHFETADPWESVSEMAEYYAERIRCLDQPSVIVGGWSFGGVAAYETCLQLQAKGVKVRGILLIDSPDPFSHVPLSESMISSAINLDHEGELRRLTRLQFLMNSKMLAVYRPHPMGASCPPIVYLRSRDGYDHPNVPQWLSDRSNRDSATQGWKQLTSSPVTTLDIPGHHFNPFHPMHVSRFCVSYYSLVIAYMFLLLR
ncbi:hypothetical protein AX15_002695 [Amanita polypyramis BW_CC]|nr:hypothetical protein AX15_002695 [Amanita polypyramis BW_CC]